MKSDRGAMNFLICLVLAASVAWSADVPVYGGGSPGLGETCTSECSGNLFCDSAHSGVCLAPLAIGDACVCDTYVSACQDEGWQPCDGLGICVDSVCRDIRDVKGQPGSFCNEFPTSEHDTCLNGLICNFEENTCQNDPALAGQFCGSWGGNCAEGLECNQYGFCVSPSGVGESCYEQPCAEGLSCETRNPVPYEQHCFNEPRLPSQPCRSDWQCAPGLKCDWPRGGYRLCLSGGWVGDPHMTGFNGFDFDYNGVPGQAFSLVSAPGHYQVNALIMPELVHGMTYVGAVAVSCASGHHAVIRADASVNHLTVEVDDEIADLDAGPVQIGDLALTPVNESDVKVSVAGFVLVLEVHKEVFLNAKEAYFTSGIPVEIDGVLGHTARPDRRDVAGLEHEESYYFVDGILANMPGHPLPRKMSVLPAAVEFTRGMVASMTH